MPSLESVNFDVSPFRFHATEQERKIWVTPQGDGVSLNFFNRPPDLPANATSIAQLRETYSRSMANSPVKIVSLSVGEVASIRSVALIIKVPQQPSGMAYVASLTMPFRDFSFVLKAQCQESGMTGKREAILLDRLMAARKISLDKTGKIVGQWNPDSAEYDQEFPDHPLSRARAILSGMVKTCRIDPQILRLPGFPLPSA